MKNSYELEYGVIAAMEYDPISCELYLELLQEHHFFHKDTAQLFRAIKAGAKVDIDIRQALITNHEYHATILKEMALKREIQDGARRIDLLVENGSSLDEILPALGSLKDDITDHSVHRALSLAEIKERESVQESFTRLETGYETFSDFYEHAGNHKGQTEVIFGHPKHGKTVYAVYRACGLLLAGYKGLYITMEDTHTGVARKVMVQLNDDTRHSENLFIADRSLGAKDLHDIATFIRYHKMRDNIDFVVLDYIQRVPVRGISPKDEVARVIEVSNKLTDIANEEKLFMMLLAQPHRIEKMRKGWSFMPEVYDLYGSSAIEKDAFVATSVFRPNQLDELCVRDAMGNITHSLDYMGRQVHRNSIFVKQKLNREAERSSKTLQFIHTDFGLQV